MRLSIVVAMGRDGSIGMGGRLPWPRLPADLARFRRLTDRHPLIMGSRTYLSLPARPLPNRANIVLSRRDFNSISKPYLVAKDAEAALEWAEIAGEVLGLYAPPHEPAAYVIGGAEIYRTFLPLVHAIHLTLVDAEFPSADTHFPGGVPDWTSPDTPWRAVAHDRRPADAAGGPGPANPLAMEFVTLERRAAR